MMSHPREPQAPSPLGESIKIFEHELWRRAGWQSSTILFPRASSDDPPVVILVFADEDAGRKVFEGWRRLFGVRDVHELLRVSFLSGMHPIRGRGFTLALSVDPIKGIDSAHCFSPGVRYRFDAGADPDAIARLEAALRHSKRYLLAPGSLAGGNVRGHLELAIEKSVLHHRDYRAVAPHDQDYVAIASARD